MCFRAGISHLARGSRKSSRAWNARQGKDQYVLMRSSFEYRARSAFKLAQIDEKFGFLGKSKSVVDLGAAPGGWSQIAIERCPKGSKVIMSDLLNIKPLRGAAFVRGDFLDEQVQEAIQGLAGDGKVDTVLSDMAPNTLGDKYADHLRQIELAQMAFETAKKLLKPGGYFVVKVFAGPEEKKLEADMKEVFRKFKRIKPDSSRSESSEIFFVGLKLKKVSVIN
mmetsp:Transcript_5541/g.8600  ORF Transcript_5541/g.8600 Transcript_5541/m.8600 type:complete len:223 (-) Transcript_5541:1388-2056(-)